MLDALAALGHATWFRLGDRDLATCLHRTHACARASASPRSRTRSGARTASRSRILPMSEEPCPTFVRLEGGAAVHFEEYLVRDGAPDDVVGVDLVAAARARARARRARGDRVRPT